VSSTQRSQYPINRSAANSDEGTAFSPQGVNSTDIFQFYVKYAFGVTVPDSLVQQILAAYPDDPSVNVIASLGPTFRPGPPFGSQFRRSASFFGDAVFIANRRLTCQTWAAAGVPAYCYRFNAIPAGIPPIIGVTHFQEVSFVFYNIEGVGYTPAAVPPFTNKSEAYINLSRFMDSNWISFVHDLDPNAWRNTQGLWNGSEAMWPKYDVANPQNIVFDANMTSYAELDTWRAEGIKLINDNNAGVYHR
jgi:carboxylesterase type B